MHKIFCHSLMAAAATAAGVVVTASSAFAQAAPPVEETVNFQGEVGSVCIFDNVVDGQLGYNGFDVLDSQDVANGGQSGSVDLSCTGSWAIEVSLPQDNGSTNDLLGNALNYGVQVEETGLGVIAANDTGVGPTISLFPLPVDETLEVDMYVANPGPIPSGSYNYNVILTATPQ
ncbi:MAG: hypothetical protein AAF572_10625 [Cyanobacteria bacterium P01_B01_bin.77]